MTPTELPEIVVRRGNAVATKSENRSAKAAINVNAWLIDATISVSGSIRPKLVNSE